MKKLLLYTLLLFASFSNAQQSMNLTLLSHWNDTTLKIVDGDQIWNDLIGWADSVKHKEYLIAGSADSIYFFDITDPTQMIKCDVKGGHAVNSVNRDYDLYDHYVYCVSDMTRGGSTGALQIFDLQYLPDSVHKVYDTDTLSIASHTIFIEASRKRMYLCANTHKPAGFRSMAVHSLDNPEHPVFLAELNTDLGCTYTHETFVKNDTAFCSCGNAGLFIFDLTDLNNQKLLSSITPPYVQNGYNHSSWLDSTGKYLMFTDETQGMGIKIYDIHDIRNPDFLTVWNSHPGALPHNAYWNGRWGVVSSYEDGVYVYDLKGIENYSPFQVPPTAGYYDTYPKNGTTYHGFHGCWGVWPYLPSGNVIASDISEGLFVLRPSPTLFAETATSGMTPSSVYPNPISGTTYVSINSLTSTVVTLEVNDIMGRNYYMQNFSLRQGNNQISIEEWSQLPHGIYLLVMSSGTTRITQKLIR
jgi:choice-of-anchor B domain-containing protein